MGALLLGRMLTRPDMGAALECYIVWAEKALATVSQLSAPFLLPGGIGRCWRSFDLCGGMGIHLESLFQPPEEPFT